MKYLFLDFETYSEADIKKVGSYAYASHPSTKIICMSWAVNHGQVKVWEPMHQEMPLGLAKALEDPSITLVSHGNFDRLICNQLLRPLPATCWVDAMSIARCHGLPPSLDELCTALAIPAELRKLKESTRLINIFSKPNKKTGKQNDTRGHKDWPEFIRYNLNDTVALRACFLAMPRANNNPTERALWLLDQEINDRGIPIDLQRVGQLTRIIQLSERRLSQRMLELTGGINSAQAVKLKEWINASGQVPLLEDLTKASVACALTAAANDDIREVLEIRQELSQSSTKKLISLGSMAKDGRIRGTLTYCGAGRTGRWSGKHLQPQNMPRSSRPTEQIEADLQDSSKHDHKLVKDALRSVIAGNLVACDLSNIEGRVAAWITNTRWKLKAFEDFDKGEGHDLYVVAYAKAFGIAPENVLPEQRSIGKVSELAFAYGGGVNGGLTFCGSLAKAKELADAVLAITTTGELNRAKRHFDMEPRTIDEHIFTGIDVLKNRWREAHPEIASAWCDLSDAFIMAIRHGTRATVCKCTIERRGKDIYAQLPSGRYLIYYNAKVKKEEITFWAPKTSGRWEQDRTYGGKLFENICQAIARDQLALGLLAVDEYYPIIFHVHDEIVVELEEEKPYAVEHLEKLMCTRVEWNCGLPLAAAGWAGDRYRKD